MFPGLTMGLKIESGEKENVEEGEEETRRTSIHVHMHTLVKVKMRGSWQRLMGRRRTEIFSDVFLHSK